jgi:hypothetical protein
VTASPSQSLQFSVPRDGLVDIITAGPVVPGLLLHQNNGGATPSWTKRELSDNNPNLNFVDSPTCVRALDVDADNQTDAVVTARGAVYWFRNTGSTPWTRNTISFQVGTPTHVAVGNVNDDDALPDAVAVGLVAGFGSACTLMWFKNPGVSGVMWGHATIATPTGSCFAATVAIADLNTGTCRNGIAAMCVWVVGGADTAELVVWAECMGVALWFVGAIHGSM